MPVRIRDSYLEQSLTAVLEISQAINLSLGLKPMLQMLAEKFHTVMSYDCAVILLDPETLLLTWAGYYGISDTYVDAMNAQHNNLNVPEMSLGATGRAFHTRQPVQINDFRDSSVRLWRETAEREGIASFIATPLVFQDRVLGFINCYTRRPHVFSSSEVELLRILGNQAAIAVEAAGLFDRQHQRAQELDRLNRQLGEQRALLEYQNSLLQQGEQIHEQLTEVLLRDAGLEAIVARIADLMSRPVYLYDARWNQLTAAREPVDDEAPAPRHIIPVGPEGDGLGFLAVAKVPSPVEGLELRALEHGATIVAFELLKQRAVLQVEQQVRGGLLDDVLGGEYDGAEALTRRARRLGFDLDRSYRVLAVSLDEPRAADGPRQDLKQRQRQLLDVALQVVQAHWPSSLVTVRGELVALVCPENMPASDMARLVREELKRALRGGTVSVGIGSRCVDIGAFATSFGEARYCLELIHRLEGEDRSLCMEDLGLYRFLIGTQTRAQLTTFAHERLDELIQYDNRHRGDLLETLTCYLAAECSLAHAARRLVLHANTVQYRLRRVEELTGLRVRSAPGLLELQLALLIGVLVPREFPELAAYAGRLVSAAL